MESIINKIMEASGAVQNPAAYRRYLRTLSERSLTEKLADLEASCDRQPQMEFWRSVNRNLKPTLA